MSTGEIEKRGRVSDDNHDVAICGAGLAGLTLARQLRLTLPELSICLIDRTRGPFPDAAFKIGESTVEVASVYLADILKLRDYFERSHLKKMGLRYFYGDATQPPHLRPELGLAAFPRFDAYQIDRGILENDLRDMVRKDGVELLDGWAIDDIDLADGDGSHEIRCRQVDGGAVRRIRCRWVIDAMGRRHFLQKKLNLVRRCSDKIHSSAWFRVARRIDVADLVPQAEHRWHERVPSGLRYHSTCHFMGNGRWVWLIPLSSGCTSVGIVTDEAIHPFESYNSFERAMQWLDVHEPVLAAHLDRSEPLDFKTMRNYSFSTKRAFSHERWACVGEAAVFPDPVYSQGSDLIAIANTVLTRLIDLDVAGALTPELVDTYDGFFLATSEFGTKNLQFSYPFHGRDLVMACKFLWDVTTGWAFACPLLFSAYALDPAAFARVQKVKAGFAGLALGMSRLFADWATKTKQTHTFDFLDYLSLPAIKAVYERNLQRGRSVEDVVEDHRASMHTFEELAQAIFLVAVEDLHPGEMSRFEQPLWLNAWKVGLDPARWAEDGLFNPTTEPRNLEDTRRQIRDCFRLTR